MDAEIWRFSTWLLTKLLFFQFVNILHLKKHLGETPHAAGDDNISDRNEMPVHDLKIIQTSMGLIQYACLLVGCFTVRILIKTNSQTNYSLSTYLKLICCYKQCRIGFNQIPQKSATSRNFHPNPWCLIVVMQRRYQWSSQ